MKPQNRNGILLRVVTGLMLITIFAVVVFIVQAQAAGLTTYAGRVVGSEEEFVAIGVGGDSVTVYICDGRTDTGIVTVAEWFSGPLVDNAINITNDAGVRVEATVSETSAQGRFTFPDGTVKEFTLELLPGTSGLFRAEFAFGETEYVAGWLVLPDGSVRGAARNRDSGELTPASFEDFNAIVAPVTDAAPIG